MKQLFFFILFGFFSAQCLSQEQNISNGEVFDGEPYLAVNPSNSQHIVIAWMGHKVLAQLVINIKTSFDGGLTWTDEVEIPHISAGYSSPDPCLVFKDENTLLLSYIDYSSVLDEGTVLLRKSVDGGLTWGDPVAVINMDTDPGKRPIDRPWMAVDKSGGTYDGHVYITSMNLQFGVITPPPYHPYISISTNEGSSFDSWSELDAVDWETGSLLASPLAFPVVGSDGALHIVYPSWVISHDPRPRYILATSNDGGVSFSYQTIYYVDDAPEAGDKKGSYQLVIDPVNPDHLNFFYLGDVDGDTDVLMRETTDRGATWTDVVKVNDDPSGNNRLQDLLWADYDQGGDLVIAWRDRRNASSSGYEVESEIWGAFKDKDSTTFSENFRVSTELVAYDTILASAGNDVMSLKVVNDTVSATWGDARDGSLDIWFARFTTNGNLLSVHNILKESLIEIFPNPTQGKLAIRGNEILSVNLFNNAGVMVMEKQVPGVDLVNIDLSEKYGAGVFFLKILTKDGIWTERIVIE